MCSYNFKAETNIISNQAANILKDSSWSQRMVSSHYNSEYYSKLVHGANSLSMVNILRDNELGMNIYQWLKTKKY